MVKLFRTTLTEDNAIAAAHIMGLSIMLKMGYNMPAAMGIPIKL